jgi:hypothetical protein
LCDYFSNSEYIISFRFIISAAGGGTGEYEAKISPGKIMY